MPIRIPDSVQASASVRSPACLLQIKTPIGALSPLREIVARVCGDALGFMRVEACDHGAGARVLLSLPLASVDGVMSETMRMLPEAEFGRSRRIPGSAP